MFQPLGMNMPSWGPERSGPSFEFWDYSEFHSRVLQHLEVQKGAAPDSPVFSFHSCLCPTWWGAMHPCARAPQPTNAKSVHTSHEQSSLGPWSVPSDKQSDFRTDLAKRKETWDSLETDLGSSLQGILGFWGPPSPNRDLEVGLTPALNGHAHLAHRVFKLWRGTARQSHPKAQDREPSCLNLKQCWKKTFTLWRGMACSFPYCSASPEKPTDAQHELQHPRLACLSHWVPPHCVINPCTVLLLIVSPRVKLIKMISWIQKDIPSHLPPLDTVNNCRVAETLSRPQGLPTDRSNENSIQT